MVRKGEALVVDAAGALYCADGYTKQRDQPIKGDVYANVSVGTFTFNKVFTIKDYYLFALDDINVHQLIDGLYEDYSKMLTAASKAFRNSNGQKYKLHIDGVRAGDAKFQKDFEEYVKNR